MMAENGEVALFIDFENVRYGLKNNYAREPDPQILMAKARKYGPVALAVAYADFTEHPDFYRRKLEVAGITPRDVPRRSPDVAHKSSSDMAMLMDIIDCLLDRPTVNTLILMTGDSDFIRVVARARHRFGKRVIISGVPGSVSNDLIASADGADPIVEPEWSPTMTQEPALPYVKPSMEETTQTQPENVVDGTQPLDSSLTQESSTSDAIELAEPERRLIQLIDYLERNRPYLTYLFIKSHALSPTSSIDLSAMQLDLVLAQFKKHGILRDEIKTQDGRNLRYVYFIRDHPIVQKVLKDQPPSL